MTASNTISGVRREPTGEMHLQHIWQKIHFINIKTAWVNQYENRTWWKSFCGTWIGDEKNYK